MREYAGCYLVFDEYLQKNILGLYNILLHMHNSSHHAQPHTRIVKYCSVQNS